NHRCLAAAPSGSRTGVKIARVNDPGDQRPGFLWIPAPVATPGVLGPDRTCHHSEGPQREGKSKESIGDQVDLARAREPLEITVDLISVFGALLDEIED